MDFIDFIGPWMSLLAILIPLVVAERWIHQHCYGVGYLLFNDKKSATGFYYIVFFPGVVLHEFTQYLVAGALNVPLKKLELRFQEQDNGTMRYDFVTIDRTDSVRAGIIGGVPFLLAAFIVYHISTSILDLHSIPEAFGTGKVDAVLRAIQSQFNTPDFWLWLYILFTISNGMIPTKADRQGWWLVLAAAGVLSVIFLVMGLDNVLLETLTGPVVEAVRLVTTSLGIILLIDFVAILVLGITEDSLERYRGFKMDYSGGHKKVVDAKPRQPGSNVPLPKGQLMPSVYNLHLPIPPIPDKPDPRAMARAAASDVASGRPPVPAGVGGMGRPAGSPATPASPATSTGSFPMRPLPGASDEAEDAPPAMARPVSVSSASMDASDSAPDTSATSDATATSEFTPP